MSDSYLTPCEEKSSLGLNNFQEDIDKFNDAIDVKVKYINEGIIRDLSGKKVYQICFFTDSPHLVNLILIIISIMPMVHIQIII